MYRSTTLILVHRQECKTNSDREHAEKAGNSDKINFCHLPKSPYKPTSREMPSGSIVVLHTSDNFLQRSEWRTVSPNHGYAKFGKYYEFYCVTPRHI